MAHVEIASIPLEVVRDRLGQMTDSIIGRLKDRSTLPLNLSAYQPGAILLDPTMAIGSTDGGLPAIPDADIRLEDKLIPFYTQTVLPRLCEPTDDPSTYIEAVSIDTGVLLLMSERINLGRYVAIAKTKAAPDMWDLVENTQGLMSVLRDARQEERVIAGVRSSAAIHGLDEELGESVFRWVIEQTIGVEVEYMQRIHEG